MSEQLEKFIDHCRAILRERGKDEFVGVYGHPNTPGRLYADDHVTVVEAEVRGRNRFEITVHYEGDVRRINAPVIMLDGEHTIYHHDDWLRVDEHVRGLITAIFDAPGRD